VFLVILVLSGLLNFAYFFPIVYTAFFGQGADPGRCNEASPALWVPLAITALLSLVLGIMPNAGLAFYHLAWQAATSLITGPGYRLAGGTP
jgi:multicomponent Na+:H+ antiporter subunit D